MNLNRRYSYANSIRFNCNRSWCSSCKQREQGKKADGHDGSPIENEANGLAGVLMRKFRYLHPEIYLEK